MAKIEPTVLPAAHADKPLATSTASAPASAAPLPAETMTPIQADTTDPRKLDQLSRIEDKTARIEEKFARYEAVLTRAEASLERSAHKVDAAAGTMDFAAIRGEVAALRARIDSTPRVGTLFVTAIVTALLTVALTVLVLRFGVPGLFGSLLIR